MDKRSINLGSGQRRFESTPEMQWVNIDCVMRPPDQVPDVFCDGKDLDQHFEPESIDNVVLHHVFEHWPLGEAPIYQCHKVLKPGGSLLIFIPDIRALAIRWLEGEISDFIYVVNLMGANQGLPTDLHKWHYTPNSLTETLKDYAQWSEIKPYDWRNISGFAPARDWWILAYEAVK